MARTKTMTQEAQAQAVEQAVEQAEQPTLYYSLREYLEAQGKTFDSLKTQNVYKALCANDTKDSKHMFECGEPYYHISVRADGTETRTIKWYADSRHVKELQDFNYIFSTNMNKGVSIFEQSKNKLKKTLTDIFGVPFNSGDINAILLVSAKIVRGESLTMIEQNLNNVRQLLAKMTYCKKHHLVYDLARTGVYTNKVEVTTSTLACTEEE